MSTCNLVFGRTGCGKTSLKNMICGLDPEPDSLTSGTSDAQVLDVISEGKRYLYVDTAGILDNRGDGEDLKQSRADKVNRIGLLLKEGDLQVSRVFYCVASTERLLKEEIDWLADIIQMLGGERVMQVFAVVLTKVDDGFQKKKFEKDFESQPLVKMLKAAFTNCPIVTSGYNNVDSVKKLLVPVEEPNCFAVKPDAIKTITPKADLETQLAQTQAKLAEVMKAMEGKDSAKVDIKAQIASLEGEIDDMTERIANAGWWCPGPEIEKASRHIRRCRSLIRELKSNEMKSDEDKSKFERQKLELLDVIRDAETELKEKMKLGQLFMRLLR